MRTKLNQRQGSQYGSVDGLLTEEVHARRLSNAKTLLAVGAVSIVAAGFVATLHSPQTMNVETSNSIDKKEHNVIHVVESRYHNGETYMFEKPQPLKFGKLNKKTPKSYISIDENQVFQEIIGFGGAFTEASALNFKKLPLEKQEEILRLYFDQDSGAAYSFGRVPMNSCDFSVDSYSFDDVDGDVNLDNFDDNVTHDTKAMIPLIRRALERRPDIKLFLSPWSPPAWMKLPNSKGEHSMLGSENPVGLDPKYQSTWALYFSKFISAYKRQGISFWGLTPQNEPMFAAPWEACSYNAEAEASFVGDFLGPQIRKDHPEVKILVFDHNRDAITQWASAAYDKASEYVDGVAFHWYNGDGRELDGALYYNHLNDTHHLDPSKLLVATEACNCPGVATGDAAWFRAQRYGHDIISDLNNWAHGWVDWNLILDHTGGPNHLNNTCDAPILLTENEKDFKIQPLYYFIKHFSGFVPPGSRRIGTDVHVQFDAPGEPALFDKYLSAVHACDGSSRQFIYRTLDNKLQIKNTNYCIDIVHEWFGDKIELVKCIYTSNVYEFTSENEIKFNGKCLSVAHGSNENGATITLDSCNSKLYQKWIIQNNYVQNKATNYCITAGYAFVQAISFQTPTNRIVLVVQNENTQNASFYLTTKYGQVKTIVPNGAIRTFYWDL